MPPRSKTPRHPDGRRPEGSQRFTKLGTLRFLGQGPRNDDVRRMLKAAGVRSFDLSIVFLDGRQMRALNRKALGHDYVTDVITFDMGKDRRSKVEGRRSTYDLPPTTFVEGEIYICPAEARRNACAYGESFERELLRYIAHGILHLLGYDDATEKQRALMRREEDRLLNGDHLY